MLIKTSIIPEGFSAISEHLVGLENRENWPLITGPLCCDAEIDRFGPEMRIRVSFSGAVHMECSRCLKEYDEPVAGEVEVILHPQQGASERSSDDDDVIYYYSDESPDVDISPALFDEIMISLPIQPLCEAACPGLMVESKASVPAPSMDPRWEKLRRLRGNSDT